MYVSFSNWNIVNWDFTVIISKSNRDNVNARDSVNVRAPGREFVRHAISAEFNQSC